MECYRHLPSKSDKYCVVIFVKNDTGKIGLVVNTSDEENIRNYWKYNEKNYTILEVKPIQNIQAFQYFQYWMKLPRVFKTEDQRRKKFDFYKYVCGADLSDKYRGIEFISEIKEENEVQ